MDRLRTLSWLAKSAGYHPLFGCELRNREMPAPVPSRPVTLKGIREGSKQLLGTVPIYSIATSESFGNSDSECHSPTRR